MSIRLSPFEIDRLRSSPLTYDEVGATLGELPGGYHHLEHIVVIGQGPDVFETATAKLMAWGLQRRAGLRVDASSDLVEKDGVAIVRVGLGPLAVRAPVRVVLVVDDSDRRGFAYGTLPGHPESGEELFVVDRAPDGTVTLTIRAFSRPGSGLARFVGPLGRMVQRWITRRYGRALSR